MEIILLILVVLLLFLWLNSKQYATKANKEYIALKTATAEEVNALKTANAETVRSFNNEISQLKNEITYLEKLKRYEVIVDAEREALRILQNAHDEASTLVNQATAELKLARSEAKDIRTNASDKSNTLVQKAESQLRLATLEAEKIINIAKERAEEVAGDAYRALKEADNLEKTAQAMRNVIEGYGDKYLAPSYTLLDELADEFSHTDAGNELKSARDRAKLMVTNGTAAQCDYVENNRKYTAINFVLHAFNGKVDSIVAMVKHDNYGTLEQKIKDAFYLVNNLGMAFRNAKINEEYLHARLQELHWATITQELKLREREEQRIIKEQIREEEKARREYEKAIKDAAKEEELLKKAIEKVQREVAQASEEQKANYEARLLELTGKLQAAEEKNQRALSMAQQTRTGHVYIISNIGSFGEHVYKIGMTRRLEPLDRIKELGDASVPFEFDVHSMIMSEDAPALEKQLHKVFLQKQMNKVNPRKEFFKVSLKDIREEIESLGIAAKWTMTAEAREYRESLAVEQDIINDPALKDKWLHQQLEAADALELMEEEIEA